MRGRWRKRTQSTEARFPAARGGGADTAFVHESGTAVADERVRRGRKKAASGIGEEEENKKIKIKSIKRKKKVRM